MPKPDLSIIIVSYNTKQLTKNCLDSIHKSLNNSDIKVEIIVIDNGSSDGSVIMLKKFSSNYSNIRIIVNKSNKGFGKANNQGIKTANADYILLLNSDIVVLNNAIDNLYRFYRQNEIKINFLGGKLLNKDLSSQPSCGPEYSLPMIFAHLFLRGDYWHLTRNSPDKLSEVDWISGACILTKKDYLNRVNGFDEKIFMYMDEIDLLYRAKHKGMRVFFYPDAQFIHYGSASSGNKTYPILQVFKGLVYFYEKNRSSKAQLLLKIMLKLKAAIGVVLGYLVNNDYLKQTYGKAYKMVSLVG